MVIQFFVITGWELIILFIRALRIRNQAYQSGPERETI